MRSEKEEDFFTIQDDNFPLMPLWLHVGHKIMLGAAAEVITIRHVVCVGAAITKASNACLTS